MKKRYPKGSEWRKWDLHVHTPIDHNWDNKPNINSEEDKKNYAKKFVETAINKEISLISITNHNFYENEDDLLIPYIRQESKNKPLTVLPGFEITVKDGSGIHVLVIFPEDTNNEDIMGIVDQLFPANEDKFNNGRVKPSSKYLEEIKNIIDESVQDAIYIFAHADSDNGILSERSGNNKVNLWLTDFVRIAQLSKAPDDFDKGFMYNVVNNIDVHYKKKMAYITASDCRTLTNNDSNSINSIGENYTWVKADPTFEGLKQIIYEPEDRIKIQSHEPDMKNDYYIIDKVRFIDESGKNYFSNEWIDLNKNLNTIIGGKSTGKSLLLYHIAKSIDPKQVIETSKELDINYNDLEIDFEVKWKDGRIDNLNEEAESKKRQITYIPQMYINRLAEPNKENRNKLNSLIKNILLESDEYKKFYNRQIKLIKNEKTKLEIQITELFDLKEEIKNLKTEFNKFSEKEVIENEIKNIKDKINNLKNESKLNEEEVKRHSDLIRLKEEKKHKIRYNNNLLNILNEYTKNVGNEIDKMIINLKSESKKIKNSLNKTDYGLINILDKPLNEIGDIKNRIRQNINKKKKEINQNNKKLLEEKEILNKKLDPLLEKIKNKKKLNELQNDLQNQYDILEKIEKIKVEIKNSNSNIKTIKEDIFSNYQNIMKLYRKIISELTKTKFKKIADNINLSVNLKFNENKFYKYFTDIFDKRSNLNEEFNFFNAFNEFEFDKENHINNIFKVFNFIFDNKEQNLLRLKSGNSFKDAVFKLFDDYFEIDFDLVQNKDKIMNMSPGKRGVVLLKLYLQTSNAKYPILIDQPEDNLDNRTIYEELNTFIRDKKVDRQIIIVTHNANLVVSADAEEVIIANQKGQQAGDNKKFKFEYITGSLENSFNDESEDGVLFQKGIREHACEILEGGRKAFENREKKYGF